MSFSKLASVTRCLEKSNRIGPSGVVNERLQLFYGSDVKFKGKMTGNSGFSIFSHISVIHFINWIKLISRLANYFIKYCPHYFLNQSCSNFDWQVCVVISTCTFRICWDPWRRVQRWWLPFHSRPHSLSARGICRRAREQPLQPSHWKWEDKEEIQKGKWFR